MQSPDRRNVVIGLAARFPALHQAAIAGATAADLCIRFAMPLDETDMDLLRTLTLEEIREFEQTLERQFAEVYQYGL